MCVCVCVCVYMYMLIYDTVNRSYAMIWFPLRFLVLVGMPAALTTSLNYIGARRFSEISWMLLIKPESTNYTVSISLHSVYHSTTLIKSYFIVW